MKVLIIVIHLMLVLIAYTAWLWVDWRIIAVVAFLHLLMLELLRGRPLSRIQFPEDRNRRFYEWWLGKIGINVMNSVKWRKRVRIFMQYVLPVIIVGLAWLLQVVFNVSPLVKW